MARPTSRRPRGVCGIRGTPLSERAARAATPASERIAEDLRDRILRGDLEPGGRIRQEVIAEEYGASRLPVRDALRLLEGEGLVRLVPNSGAWVSALNMDELEEVYRIREALEPLLLGLSLPHLAEGIGERLILLAHEMESAGVEDFLRLDREFHHGTYHPEAAPTLHAMVERLWNRTESYRRAFVRHVGIESLVQTHAEHHLLADAVIRRDRSAAETLLRLHIRRTRVELAQHPEGFQELGTG
ncbi:MAG: GntR family transcriptional regulator [bacterium]|nr:GntR family transcriptional regulator [bacterium]